MVGSTASIFFLSCSICITYSSMSAKSITSSMPDCLESRSRKYSDKFIPFLADSSFTMRYNSLSKLIRISCILTPTFLVFTSVASTCSLQSGEGLGYPNQVQGGSLANRVRGGYAYGHCGSRKNIATFYICIEGKIFVVLKVLKNMRRILVCKERHAIVGIYIREWHMQRIM